MTMTLNEHQRKQVEMQLKQHNHPNYETDIVLGSGHMLKNFSVHSKVLRPDKLTTLYLAQWLFFNNGMYLDKTVLDMGSGSGILGVVAGLHGAKKVIFSDLSPAAVENTKENITKFELQDKSSTFHGDLFEKIDEKLDVIIFNHPFFFDSTIEDIVVSGTMLDSGHLIHRFFDDAKNYLNDGGVMIMPYFHLAGEQNDPEVQIKKHPEYDIKIAFRGDIDTPMHKGPASIYIIWVK